MSDKVSYVIAAYIGKRNGPDVGAYSIDRMYYLRKHLQMLDEIEHDLHEVVVMINADRGTAVDVRSLPHRVGRTPVRFFTRPNVGISYGAFAEAIRGHVTGDWTILFEDDYCPVLDFFDAYLVSIAAQDPSIGMVCGTVAENLGQAPVASVFLGISPTRVLRDVVVQPKTVVNSSAYMSAWAAQIYWSEAIANTGHHIVDWCAHYACPFWESTRSRVLWFHGDVAERSADMISCVSVRALAVPLQALERDVLEVVIQPHRLPYAAKTVKARLSSTGFLELV